MFFYNFGRGGNIFIVKCLQRLLMFYWLGKVFLKTFEYVSTLYEVCTKQTNNKICSLIIKKCVLYHYQYSNSIQLLFMHNLKAPKRMDCNKVTGFSLRCVMLFYVFKKLICCSTVVYIEKILAA